MAYLDGYNLSWCAGEQIMTRVTTRYKIIQTPTRVKREGDRQKGL